MPWNVAPMRVLLVEDDSDVVRAVRDTLAVGPHAFRVCDDGASWSKTLDEAGADVLIIADLKGCDAVDVCRSIRSKENGSHRTAVVVLTHRHDLTRRLLAFSAGADDWLEKPVDPRELLSRLERWSDPPLDEADLAERRRLAIRGIVRAIGHELNNPLGAALMGVDLVLRRGSLPPDTVRDLGVVRDNLERITAILTAFQTLKDRPVPTSCK